MNWILFQKVRILLLMSVSQFGLIGFCALKANPPTVKSGGTLYLKDAGDYINTVPILPKFTATVTPTPTATPAPRPTATPQPALKTAVDDDDDTRLVRDYPRAIIHRSSMTVGSQIPVPTQYAAPQVVGSLNGGVTVVPATPTTFQTIQTGVTMGTDASGATTVSDTELSGVVNYGQAIRTVVPVFNSQGQRIGSQVITVSSNPIIVPVTTTIQISR